MSSQRCLTRLFRRYQKSLIEGVHFELHDDDIYHWNVTIVGPVGTFLENGLLKASMVFPKTYPLDPPVFKFTNFFHHPNIYPSGEVAISILQTENDEIPLEVLGYSPEEIWQPMQNPESVVISIISLLLDPNPDSAANVDAAIEFRENRSVYEEKVRSLIRS
ncbi:hypothetical protein RCL1_008277 [Eukaryota sp. TZLM3-RCL]